MTTTTVIPSARVPQVGAHDRTFYSGISIAMALTVLAGFGPTYFFRAWTHTPTISGLTTLSPLLHVHGLLFSAWVVLFVVQTTLIAQRRVAVHRRLGVAGVALAALMVVVGLSTAIEGVRRGAAPPGVEPLAFLSVPFFDLVLFTGFVTAAVVQRRNREAHKRLMLLAYVSIIAAAVARMPGMLSLGPFGFFGASFLFVVAGIVYDKVSRGRVHRVYAIGGTLIALSVPGRLIFSSTGAWRSFAEFLTR